MDSFKPTSNFENDAITMDGVKLLLAAKTEDETQSVSNRWPEPFQKLSERGKKSEEWQNLEAKAAQAAREGAIAAGTPESDLDALGISESGILEHAKAESWEAAAALGRLAVKCAGIARGEIAIPEPIITAGETKDSIAILAPDFIRTSLSPNGKGNAQTDIWIKSLAFSNYARELIKRWGEAEQQGVTITAQASDRRAKDAPSQYLHIRIEFQAFPATAQGKRSHYGATANAIFSLFLQDVRTVCAGNVQEQRTFDTPTAKFFWLILDAMREGYTGICKRCGRPFVTDKRPRANKRQYCPNNKCAQADVNARRPKKGKANKAGNTAQAQRDLQ